MASTWLPSVGQGTLANRPGTPDNARGTVALYYASDIGTMFAYVGNTWNSDEDNNGDGSWVAVGSSLTVDATAATLTVAAAPNQVIELDKTGGIAVSLPAATGSGRTIDFVVKTVSTTGYVITTNGTDAYQGGVYNQKAGTATYYPSLLTTGNLVLTLNGTTTGGSAVGDNVTLQDIATGVWQVCGTVTGSGTQATPFSV